MSDDWETAAEEFVIRPKTTNTNKWAGEDADEDVKDSWEDEEEKKDEEKTVVKTEAPAKVKPNKTALQASKEAEALRIENMTPEEKLAEKLRIQREQEESDLNSALETFGITEKGEALDNFNPKTKEEFKEFGDRLSAKVAHYKDSPHFQQFVEELVRGVCSNLSAPNMRKVKQSIDFLITEKTKLDKAKKSSAKGKNKVSLRAEADDLEGFKKYGDDYGNNEYSDNDYDFM